MVRSALWIGISAFLVQAVVAQPTWRRSYGAFDEDRGVAARAVNEDRIIMVGSTGSFGNGSSDIYVMATDGAGIRIWSRTLGGPEVESPTCFRLAADGDLLIAGIATGAGGYDGFLMRTDPEGEPRWMRTYGGADWDFIHDVKELPNGDLVLAGATFGQGEPGSNAWLFRTDAQGELIWERTFGGSARHEGRAVVGTPDGGLVMAGALGTADRDLDVLVVKVDGDGNEVWTRTHGGDSLDVARDIVLAPNGGFSLVGTTRSFSVWNEGYHLKLFDDGTFHWQFNWGQINDQEFFEHMVVLGDEYQIAGYTRTSGGGGRDMILQRVTINGGFVYGHTFGGTQDDEGASVDLIGSGFLLAGSTYSYGAGNSDLFLVRTGANGLTASQNVINSFDPLSVTERTAVPTLVVAPNPSTGCFRAEVEGVPTAAELWDMQGRKADELLLTAGVRELCTSARPGAYILRVRFADGALRAGRVTLVAP